MDELRELYQEVILDHGRRPRNKGALPEANHTAEGHNPLCGDEVIIRVTVDDGVVQRAMFEGTGCAISTAAASTLTEAISGKTVAEVEALFGQFHDMVTGKAVRSDGEELGKLCVFQGVAEFPLRVKCATLAWHTLRAALSDNAEPVTTEA